MNNNIFVMGGIAAINGQDSCLDKVLLYKKETDEWQEISSLPKDNIFFGCTSIGNKIYIMGGMKGVPPNYTTLYTVNEGEYSESNVTEYQQNKIKVFPDPAKKLITIKYIDPKNAEISYKIMNVNGKIIQKGKLVNDKNLGTKQ